MTEQDREEGLGYQLLRIAHESLRVFVLRGQFFTPPLHRLPRFLREPASSFVTVYHRGQLRGCIGSTDSRFPLALDIARNAAAAARDPRFPPVLPGELPGVSLEVSVLHPPRLLIYDDYEDLLGKLRPGIDGVIINWEKQRALLLPHVWARIPEPAGFLHALCHKAQIPEQMLRVIPPAVTVSTFEAHAYKEDDDSPTERT